MAPPPRPSGRSVRAARRTDYSPAARATTRLASATVGIYRGTDRAQVSGSPIPDAPRRCRRRPPLWAPSWTTTARFRRIGRRHVTPEQPHPQHRRTHLQLQPSRRPNGPKASANPNPNPKSNPNLNGSKASPNPNAHPHPDPKATGVQGGLGVAHINPNPNPNPNNPNPHPNLPKMDQRRALTLTQTQTPTYPKWIIKGAP